MQSQDETRKVSVSMIFFFLRKRKTLQNRHGWKMSQQQENVTAEILTTQEDSCVFWKGHGKRNPSAGCFWNGGLCFAGYYLREYGQRGQDGKDDRRKRN